MCICVSVWIPLPAGTVLFQQLSSSRRNTVACVATCIASACPFELTRWTLLNAAVHGLSLACGGYRDHPTVVHCSRGSSPFPPASPNTHAPHIYCITHMIDIHHTSATVYPSMRPAAKSRIQSFMVNLQVISILGMIIFMSCQW